jgi:hypothetical protein
MGIGGDQSGSIRVVSAVTARCMIGANLGFLPACIALWYRRYEAYLWVGPDDRCN